MNVRFPLPTTGLVDTDGAQEILKIGRRTLFRRLAKGMPHITIGDRTLFCENCLRAMRGNDEGD